MARIQVRVSDEQKELWEDYADNSPEYRSLAELVRMAVTREIQDWDGSEGGDLHGETANKIDSMDKKMSDLLAQMEYMTNGLSMSPMLSNLDVGLSELDVSSLPDNEGDAYYPDKEDTRRKLREVAENIKNIRETEDGGFYQGNKQ
jgi:hypothetical protein